MYSVDNFFLEKPDMLFVIVIFSLSIITASEAIPTRDRNQASNVRKFHLKHEYRNQYLNVEEGWFTSM